MFLSRRYRPNMRPFYGLIAIEFCLTVALLTFTGIAAPNLYRTKLWQDGADNGFNSSPVAGLYAAANYRPYTTPRCWSQFITNYNLVVAVLSMFLMLVKGTTFMLHVLPPIVSTILHAILIALYSVAAAFQASSDTTDPRRPQNGPPWYITKNCSVAHDKSLVGYCQQAKATFACFVAMLGVFTIYFGLSLWSCFPSKAHRLEYEEKQRAKKLRWAHLDEPDPRSADSDYAVPDTPGVQLGMNPVTPRTLAFNKLGGTRDLPLRARDTSDTKTSTFALRSPGILRTPMHLRSPRENKEIAVVTSEPSASPDPEAQMYFPPPPKESIGRGR
ncbi:hypothetical protein LTR05_002274 [Lithohypha guttulata]|uniref:Uncharacterized protein n=1 Tax=Lithohypha guttulata TaxID=1690604 RepID=A0AAN7T3W7_9EURO|nr:hypothetical protein LTR05_002274 [Lithohypha guttulata]